MIPLAALKQGVFSAATLGNSSAGFADGVDRRCPRSSPGARPRYSSTNSRWGIRNAKRVLPHRFRGCHIDKPPGDPGDPEVFTGPSPEKALGGAGAPPLISTDQTQPKLPQKLDKNEEIITLFISDMKYCNHTANGLGRFVNQHHAIGRPLRRRKSARLVAFTALSPLYSGSGLITRSQMQGVSPNRAGPPSRNWPESRENAPAGFGDLRIRPSNAKPEIALDSTSFIFANFVRWSPLRGCKPASPRFNPAD